MGYNTTMIILNDALHEIRKDKDFGEKVYQATLLINRKSPQDISAGNHCNAASIISSHHADELHLLLVGGNTATELGYAGLWNLDPNNPKNIKSILNSIANKHGLKVINATSKKKSPRNQ